MWASTAYIDGLVILVRGWGVWDIAVVFVGSTSIWIVFSCTCAVGASLRHVSLYRHRSLGMRGEVRKGHLLLLEDISGIQPV